ncbi:hypothetical protein METH109765_10090 [Mesobacillus thioparans]
MGRDHRPFVFCLGRYKVYHGQIYKEYGQLLPFDKTDYKVLIV